MTRCADVRAPAGHPLVAQRPLLLHRLLFGVLGDVDDRPVRVAHEEPP